MKKSNVCFNVCTINFNDQLNYHIRTLPMDVESIKENFFDRKKFNDRLKKIEEDKKTFVEEITGENSKYDIIAFQEIDKCMTLKGEKRKDLEEKYIVIINTNKPHYKSNVLLLVRKEICNSSFNIDYDLIDKDNYLNKNIIFTFNYQDENMEDTFKIKIVNVHITGKKSYKKIIEKLDRKHSESLLKDCHIVLFLGDLNAFSSDQIKYGKSAHGDLIEILKKEDFREENNFGKFYTYYRDLDNKNASKNDHIFWLKGNLFNDLQLTDNQKIKITEEVDQSINYCCKENRMENKGFTDHSMVKSQFILGSE